MASKANIASTVLKRFPRANLGLPWIGGCDEDNFGCDFINAYNGNFPSFHSRSVRLSRVMAREVPMNGFGIADLVVISWRGSPNKSIVSNKIGKGSPVVRAFEFKLNNWKKGLMQAHRYKFFADAAILVLPSNKLPLAVRNITLFRTLSVGLWGFNQQKASISIIFTPRPQFPPRIEHKKSVIAKIIDSTR